MFFNRKKNAKMRKMCISFDTTFIETKKNKLFKINLIIVLPKTKNNKKVNVSSSTGIAVSTSSFC